MINAEKRLSAATALLLKNHGENNQFILVIVINGYPWCSINSILVFKASKASDFEILYNLSIKIL